MKKILFATLSLMVGMHCGIAQTNDFRNFRWGSTMEKVRAEEKAPFFSKLNNYELEYDDKLVGSNFKILYIFNENKKLISGIYIFSRKYSNPELYYQDYSIFFKLLTQKYGIATKEKETWNTTDPLFDKTNKKQAIADKNLNLYAVWNTERTTIKITLISIGYEIPSMQIHYTSKLLDELPDPIELKEALDKL